MATHSSKAIVIALAMLATVIGAECVRAAAKHHETIKTGIDTPSYTNFLAAESDPLFQQKLAKRIRGPYERAHPAQPQT